MTMPPQVHQNAAGEWIDARGKKFDPARHLGNPDGTPRPNKFGVFMPRPPRGIAKTRKAAAPAAPETPAPAPSPIAPETPAPAAAKPDFADVAGILKNAPGAEAQAEETAGRIVGRIKDADEFTAAAAGIAGGINTLAVLSMGAHASASEDEMIALVDAYAAAFRAYGYRPQMPPWLPPALVTATIYGPKFADKRSQDNLQIWKRKIVNGWLWLKGKFDGRTAAHAAQGVQS